MAGRGLTVAFGLFSVPVEMFGWPLPRGNYRGLFVALGNGDCLDTPNFRTAGFKPSGVVSVLELNPTNLCCAESLGC